MSSTVNLTVPFFISSDALSASLISPAFTFSDSGLTVLSTFSTVALKYPFVPSGTSTVNSETPESVVVNLLSPTSYSALTNSNFECPIWSYSFSLLGSAVHKKFAKIPPKSFIKFIIKYLFYIL